MAVLTAGLEQRRLLAVAMGGFTLANLLAALAPGYAGLWPRGCCWPWPPPVSCRRPADMPPHSIDFAGNLRRLPMFNAKCSGPSIRFVILALVIFLVPLRGANYRFNHPQALLMEPASPDRESFNAWNSFLPAASHRAIPPTNFRSGGHKMPGSIGAALPLKLSDDLTLSVGAGVIRLSPTQGLEFSEELARKKLPPHVGRNGPRF
jgi:hypothetical protein